VALDWAPVVVLLDTRGAEYIGTFVALDRTIADIHAYHAFDIVYLEPFFHLILGLTRFLV